MTALPAYAVQGALDILLQHVHTADLVGGDSISFGSHEIEQKEKECLSLQAVIDAFTDSILQRITVVCKERNQLVPIHRLPVETLITIFELTTSPSPYLHYRSIQPLLQVSSLWWTVIQSSPSFWSTISAMENPQLLKIILERSKNVPLDVYFSRVEDQNRPFFETVLPLASRMRSVVVPGDMVAAFSESCLSTKELPLLEKFAAVRSSYEQSREVPEGVLKRAPRLSHLHIAPCNFPLGAAVLSKLVDINITATVDNKPLSSAQWHTFLSAVPQIKSLFAESGMSNQFSEEPSFFHVNMPELEIFDLYQVPSLMVGILLCSVNTPRDHDPKVIVTPDLYDGYLYRDLFPIPAPSGSLLSRIREMSWIKFRAVGWEEPVVTAGRVEGSGLFTLFLDQDDRPKGELFRSLIPSAGLPNLQHISVKGSVFFEDEYFSLCISSCKRLARLELAFIGWKFSGQLEGSFNGLAQLCTDLTTLQRDKELDELYWPCPSLKHVEIATCSSADFTLILRLLKVRNGLTSGDVESGSSALPFALDELRLRILGRDGESSFHTTCPGLSADLETVTKSHNTNLLLTLTPRGKEGAQGIALQESEYLEVVGVDDSDESGCGTDGWPWLSDLSAL